MSDQEQWEDEDRAKRQAENILAGRGGDDDGAEDENGGNTESSLLSGKKAHSSVIQGMLHVSDKPTVNYLDILQTTSFSNAEESELAGGCISELQRFGIDITPVVNRLVARNSVQGTKGGRIGNVIEALTRREFASNNPDAKRRFFNKGQDSQGGGSDEG